MNARLIHKIALATILVLLTACNRIVEWPEITGQVYDKETGKPVENAFVIASWRGHWAGTIGGGTTGCMHAEVVRTDKKGRYQIPAWENRSETNRLGDQRVFLYSYAPTYLLGSALYKQKVPTSHDLAMAHGSTEMKARLDELQNIRQAAKCSPPKQELEYTVDQLVPVWKEIFQEACSLRPEPDNYFVNGMVESYLFYKYGEKHKPENYKKGCDYEWN